MWSRAEGDWCRDCALFIMFEVLRWRRRPEIDSSGNNCVIWGEHPWNRMLLCVSNTRTAMSKLEITMSV